MTLSAHEFWVAVIALCIPWLLYLLRDCIDEACREDMVNTKWRWGDKERRSSNVDVWFSHEIGLIIACLADLAILRALLT